MATVKAMIEESLDLLGGLRQIIGSADTAVVKPNLVEVPFEGTAGSVVTDPRVLEALVVILRDHGVRRVLVAEGKSVNLKHVRSGPRQAFEALGLAEDGWVRAPDEPGLGIHINEEALDTYCPSGMG